MNAEPVLTMQGDFWLPAAPELVVRGRLDIRRGRLELDGELVACMDSRQIEPGVTHSSLIEDLDVDHQLFGRITEGTLVTIPASTRGKCEHKIDPESQEFLFTQVLIGSTHMSETDGVARLDAEWDIPLGDWGGPLSIPGIGSVRVETSDGHLAVSELPDVSFRTALRRVLQPFRGLLETTRGTPTAPKSVRLATADGRSVDVHWASAQEVSDSSPEGFFDHQRLRSAHVNRWFDVTHKTHPILFVAARALHGREATLEAQTMTLGAVAEGLHEQLHGVRAIDKSTVKQLRAKASDAVPKEYRERVHGALSQLGSQTFRDRIQWLTENLEPLSTRLCGAANPINTDEPVALQTKAPRTIWTAKLMAARNNFAHQKPDNPQDLDEYIARTLALRETTRWFVAACILRELQIPAEEIEKEFERRSSFFLSMRRAHKAFPDVYGAVPDDEVLHDFEADE